MRQSKSLTSNALRLQTYADLQSYARAFATGHLNLLILCGPAGVGKSRCLREAVGSAARWIDGNASPFGIYQEAYKHRDQPIVLDDVDGLSRDRNGVRLLKSLCQTEIVKSVNWLTDAASLDRRGIPRQFETSSHVALIANQASDTYVAFQNAFLLADCWLVGVCALGAWAILARRPTWSLWVMLGASSSVFLGLMDVCFNFENGIYASARGPALALEVLLNALALGFGVWGAQLGWRACASASNTQRLTGSTHSQ